MQSPAEFWQDLCSAEAQRKVSKLRAFTVRIGKRGSPRLEFGAMAKSSAECIEQHLCLAEVGERVEAVAVRSAS